MGTDLKKENENIEGSEEAVKTAGEAAETAEKAEAEAAEKAAKKKQTIDNILLNKKAQKSSFYGGSVSGNKNYNSRHGMSTQKNHRVKHG